MLMSILQRNACELLRHLEAGEISSVELTTACLERISATDDRVGAFLRVDEKRAIAQAAAIDAKRAKNQPVGRLGGLPVAVKDVLCERGPAHDLCLADAGRLSSPLRLDRRRQAQE